MHVIVIAYIFLLIRHNTRITALIRVSSIDTIIMGNTVKYQSVTDRDTPLYFCLDI